MFIWLLKEEVKKTSVALCQKENKISTDDLDFQCSEISLYLLSKARLDWIILFIRIDS